jgi:hypothetical protein
VPAITPATLLEIAPTGRTEIVTDDGNITAAVFNDERALLTIPHVLLTEEDELLDWDE